MVRLGFVGTGTISAAMIAGLAAKYGEGLSVLVSPRSEATSRELAARYAGVTRAASNAEVVEGSDVVFLGFRPNQLEEVMAGLAFRADQLVVSLLAGAPVAMIAARVAPATRVVRMVPLPPIQYRRGPLVHYPADPLIEELFQGLGELIVVERESDLRATSHASALMSSHFEMQNAVIAWMVSRGLDEGAASRYVRAMYDGLAEVALADLRAGHQVVPEHHETRGGLNERGRSFLRQAGWFDAVGQALDAIEAHVVLKPPAG